MFFPPLCVALTFSRQGDAYYKALQKLKEAAYGRVRLYKYFQWLLC